ncbi:glycoside hydrolase family 2 TIM barrel-domain containing protein [Bacteroides caecimuris]|uniref:glycoside hydrolase family 2 TIM barrel-domain containing protein n=1 Tax=Bacteroides caecimuris TaxID=1796613 RepID=UPI0020CBFC89|nr:glycoside hydrolase family 2 TIM barrel-domain containing protein [Bacteroides caecimuris]
MDILLGFLFVKATNINYIRLSHYTLAKGFIELCDEIGMYVGNEVLLGAALQRSYETVVRDILDLAGSVSC